MDVLTDVLSTLRLKGQMYFRTEFAGSWGVTVPDDPSTIRFHLVIHGECWVSVADCDERLHLREGDFILVPHGVSQSITNPETSEATPLNELLQTGKLGEDGVLRHGTGSQASQVRMICGFCSFDEGLKHPLFYLLPPVLLIGRHTTGVSPWLADAVRVVTMESELDGPGGTAVINRLMEVLFIQAIRHQYDSKTVPTTPFISAVTDSRLRSAIEAIHERPEHDWTVTDLAALTNLSRGRFSQRFKDVVHQSPMQYLANWRLQKARQLLKETTLSIADVAFQSGYHSLPSFTRRFGKEFGISPGAFRRLP